MSHEARINDALKQLGEEFRLGMVQPEEYRARRRLLLESWYERDVTTSPGSLRSALPPPKAMPQPAPAAPAASNTPKLVLLALAVLVGIAASAWLVFGSRTPAEGQAAGVASAVLPPPASAQVLAVRRAAEDFLAVNAWEQAQVDLLLEQWRQLSPEDRARAREEPAVRTLRFRLDQNLQAEAQLVAPDAPAEERARLDLLTRFAEELDG